MASPWGRRLRPLAVLCALVLVLWGILSAVALVEQLRVLDEFGWPDENADGEVWAWTWLYLAAAASGCWVAVWGLFGLGWRPPLHLGILALVVAVGLEVAANAVQASYFEKIDSSWSFADQLEGYGDRVTFDTVGLAGEWETASFFIALPLVTAALPFALWLVVLFSGAGRKRRAPYGAGYPQQYPQPYQQQPYQQQPYQQPYRQQAQQPYQQPHQHQPVQPPPPQPPVEQPPRQPRVAWQNVPPVVRTPRPAPPRPKPPDQQETQPYRPGEDR